MSYHALRYVRQSLLWTALRYLLGKFWYFGHFYILFCNDFICGLVDFFLFWWIDVSKLMLSHKALGIPMQAYFILSCKISCLMCLIIIVWWAISSLSQSIPLSDDTLIIQRLIYKIIPTRRTSIISNPIFIKLKCKSCFLFLVISHGS